MTTTGPELYVRSLDLLASAEELDSQCSDDIAFKQYLATFALAQATAALAAATGCSSTRESVRAAWVDVAG